MKTILSGDVLGFDLGKKRTGVARAHVRARISEPLEAIAMTDSDSFLGAIDSLVQRYDASALVFGIPRGLDGQETDQTVWTKEQIALVRQHCNIRAFEIDEAATTKLAETLANGGQSIDSVAAGILLKDFLNEVIKGVYKDVCIKE